MMSKKGFRDIKAESGTSNTGTKVPDDGSTVQVEKLYRSSETQSRNKAYAYKPTQCFRIGLPSEVILRELFILESDPEFNECNDKRKIAICIAKFDEKAREWYYREGSRGNLSSIWLEFKEQLKLYCQRVDLDKIKKYYEETWPDYIRRLEYTAVKNGYAENDIYSHLNNLQDVPQEVHILTLSGNMALGELAKKLECI